MTRPLDETALKAAARAAYELEPMMQQQYDPDFRPIGPASLVTWENLLEFDEGMYEGALDIARVSIRAYLSAIGPATRPQASDQPSSDTLAAAIQAACNSAAKAPDEYCTWAMAVAAAEGVRDSQRPSKDAVEQVARAIWEIRREEEDRCDMDLEDMGKDHSVWTEARAAIAAMPAAGWRLIDENTPRDGRKVFLARLSVPGFSVVGFWAPDENGWLVSWYENAFDPTHWMPHPDITYPPTGDPK